MRMGEQLFQAGRQSGLEAAKRDSAQSTEPAPPKGPLCDNCGKHMQITPACRPRIRGEWISRGAVPAPQEKK